VVFQDPVFMPEVYIRMRCCLGTCYTFGIENYNPHPIQGAGSRESFLMISTEENRMPPWGARVMIAMSGGVDSAAVAVLLAEAGYDCLGATLRLTGDKEEVSVFEPCCGLQAAEDARRICTTLGIPHRTVRVVEVFEKTIIRYFAGQYAEGRTPNPCIRCNRAIKFGMLFKEATRLGYDYIAFGHYARLMERNGRMTLARAAYLPKDQSYVLAPLTQSQLRRSCFPLAAMTKEDARAAARRIDVVSGNKAESQEICFVPLRNYASVVEKYAGKGTPGPIRDLEGRVLGQHEGIHRYTIGQRRGLGIGAEKPLYVVWLDAAHNTVWVGRDAQSLCDCFETGPLFFGGMAPQKEKFEAWVQLRYRHQPVAGVVEPRDHGARVVLSEAQRAVTPGQWAVFYDGSGHILASAKIQQFERWCGGADCTFTQ
jgi:tRNA-specific 2-thiouridylase